MEDEIVRRFAVRGEEPGTRVRLNGRGLVRIDPTQAPVVGTLAGEGPLVVVEGAARCRQDHCAEGDPGSPSC